MKLSKIKTVLKYNKNCLPILNYGTQIDSKTLAFSNLQTYVYIENVDEVGSTYDLDGVLYKRAVKIDDYVDFPNNYTKGNEILSFELDDKFKSNTKKLIPLMGKDDLRPVMSGMFLDSEFMAATDAHVLGNFEHNKNTNKGLEFILHRELCEFIEFSDTLKIFETKQGNFNIHVAQLTLTSEGKKITIESRCVDGNYPKYKSVIPELYGYDNCIELSAKDLKDIQTLIKRNVKVVGLLSFGDEISILDKGYKTEDNVSSFKKSIIKKECKNRDLIMMPYRTDNGLPSVNFKVLMRACKGCSSVSIFFNEVNKAYFLSVEYKKTVKKTKTRAELESIINNLKLENESLKLLLSK